MLSSANNNIALFARLASLGDGCLKPLDDRAWTEMILYLEDMIKSGKQARAFMLKASLAKNILVAYRDRMSDQECHYPVKTRTLLCGLTCLLAKKSIVVIDFLPADVL